MNTGSTTSSKDKIAGQLLEAGLVDEASLAKGRELQKKEGGSLGQALVRIGEAVIALRFAGEDLTSALEKYFGLPSVEKTPHVRLQLELVEAPAGVSRAIRPTHHVQAV